MTTLIVFATNSGGTAHAAQMIADSLTANGHTVTVKDAKDVKPEDLAATSSLILGSPSWDYNDMEGQPLPEMVACINRCTDLSLAGKLCAVFGLGDSSYTYYCGAVTYLEAFIKRAKGMLVVPSLKVDGFYLHTEASERITTWAAEVAGKFASPSI